MEFEEFEDNKNLSLTRFEKMLKTNRILFFDSNEFENIISYYLENGKINLAKKAIKLGLEQHPDSSNLALFEIEIFINKYLSSSNITIYCFTFKGIPIPKLNTSIPII